MADNIMDDKNWGRIPAAYEKKIFAVDEDLLEYECLRIRDFQMFSEPAKHLRAKVG